MNIIDHIFEPKRLLLVWHSSKDGTPHHRRVVGELYKDADSISFQYLKNTNDYKEAEKEGFIGFPAFSKTSSIFNNAIDAFMSRLPPRKRADFSKYLAQYALPSNFSGSDLSLLGYTGARLASDNFELCPDFSDANEPVDLVLEVSGVKYNMNDTSALLEGTPIHFELEPENKFDPSAIAIHAKIGKLGYVSRAINKGFKDLLDRCQVQGSVFKSSVRQGGLQILILVTCR
ncbi:HIRAN domain-containing protein [Pseudomonas sp. J452]|uniref:HIRAN domain-containing protein n=1 Tax=Pseudomonas sp. J452 TaxID=2898441 RepID=UPI0021ADC074|nr:HIRAN domain-containing protein [Pseudomonas sp. J452]UUY07981.1 HIRAN domain-containing protein [Pseudomonas sp. J452]